MNNIRSTLATVWRIAAPYFRSEDRWAGRGLLAAVIAIELAIVGITVLLNQWNSRFYNALQERNWDAFVSEIIYFCVLAAIFIVLAVYQLYLNQWLQIRWRRWMTSHYLGDWLHDANHYRMQLQGDAADNPDQRMTDDVKLFVERTLNIGVGLLSSIVTLASFVVDPVGTVERGAAAPVRSGICDSRLPGLGRADLFGARHRADPSDRLAAGRHRFPAAAIRGGFPLQSGAGAGKFRADRAAARRGGRARTPAGPLRTRGRQLARHHEPDQEADGVHGQLFAGLGDLSLRPGGAGLFRAEDPARRHDADRIGVFGSVQGALSFFVTIYRTAGGVAGGGQPARRVRGGDRGGDATCDPQRPDSRRRGGGRRRDRPQGAVGATAERHAAGHRRRRSACARTSAR